MTKQRKFIAITIFLMLVMPTLALTVNAAPAQHSSATVMTHPSQGSQTVVDGASASLISTDSGITVSLRTSGLAAGHAHTLWIVVVNRPDLCKAVPAPCTGGDDILTRSAIVESNVTYGGGHIVGGSGKATFSAHLSVGDLPGGWFDTALTNPRGAEVHLIINDHGPKISGMVSEMTHTYRAGCTDASIPPIFPATAFADGTPGPNQCRLMQVAIFQQ